MTQSLLAFGMPGMMEMCIIGGIGLLIFGRRLPEVGKGLARSIVEFKKGLREVTDEIDVTSTPADKTTTPATTSTPAASPTSSI